MRGRPPLGDLESIVLLEISRPPHLPILRRKTKQVALRAQGVDPVAINGRRRPWTDGVDGNGCVGTIPFMRPELSAIGLGQADQPLFARQQFTKKVFVPWRFPFMKELRLPRVKFSRHPVHDKNSAGGYGGARIPSAKRRLPAQPRSLLRELLDNSLLTPDPVPLRTKPLGPVVPMNHCRGKSTERGGQEEKAQGMKNHSPHPETGAIRSIRIWAVAHHRRSGRDDPIGHAVRHDGRCPWPCRRWRGNRPGCRRLIPG